MRVVALVVSMVLPSVYPPATMMTSFIIATVAPAQLMGNDDTVLQLLLLSSYREMLLTAFPWLSRPPIMIGGEVFGTMAVFQYGVECSSLHLLSSSLVELVRDC